MVTSSLEEPLLDDAVNLGERSLWTTSSRVIEHNDDRNRVRQLAEESLDHFPAVIEHSDDQPSYWWPTARAWHNMIPHTFCGFDVVNEHVRAIAMKAQANRMKVPLPLPCFVGPAIPKMFQAFRVTWALFLLVPLIAHQASYCSIDSSIWLGNRSGHAGDVPSEVVSHTWMVWIIAGPLFVYLLYVEWQVLQYVIVPQVQVTGGFYIFGVQVGFYIWVVLAFGMSMIGHLDLVTNGIFLATSWAMLGCDMGHRIDCIWTEVMQQSIFKHIPWLCWSSNNLADCVQIPFRYLVFVLWAFMFARALYGLAHAVSLYHLYQNIKHFRCLRCLYVLAEKKFKWSPKGTTEEMRWDRDGQCWMTFAELEQNTREFYTPDETIDYWDNDMEQVGSSREVTERFLNWMVDYKQKSDQELLACIQGVGWDGIFYQTVIDRTADMATGHGTAVIALADCCRMYSITTMHDRYCMGKLKYWLATPHCERTAYDVLKRVLQAFGHRIVMSGILQNGFQINLKITLFAITLLIERHGDPSPLGISINTIFEVNAQMLFGICISTLVLVVQLFLWVGDVLFRQERYWTKDASFLSAIKFHYWLLKGVFAVYVVVVCYAVLKFYKVFTCKQNLFNVTGCANISALSVNGTCAVNLHNATHVA